LNVKETSQLLAAATAFDGRTIGDSDILAWSRVMADYRFEDAQQALEEHYSSSNEWLMPFHVIAGIKGIRDKRLRDYVRQHGAFVSSPGLSPEEELEERRKWAQSVSDGSGAPRALQGPR
jgi:hypothetical protein